MIEPEAKNTRDQWQAGILGGGSLDVSATNAASLLSIAISMKRIADVVAGVPYDPTPGADNSRHKMDLTDGIMHAIEQGIIVAARGR